MARIQKSVGFEEEVWEKVEKHAAFQTRFPTNLVEHIVVGWLIEHDGDLDIWGGTAPKK